MRVGSNLQVWRAVGVCGLVALPLPLPVARHRCLEQLYWLQGNHSYSAPANLCPQVNGHILRFMESSVLPRAATPAPATAARQ